MKQTLVLALAVTLLAGCEKANVEQASEEFNALPLAVQKTTRAQLPNAEIASVTKHNRNGIDVYAIRFRDEDRNPPLEVAADGTIVKYERAVQRGGSLDEPAVRRGGGGSDVSALPLAVQKAIRANTPPAEVVAIHRSEDDGKVVYDIEFAGHQHNPRVRVSQEGDLLPSNDREVDRR